MRLHHFRSFAPVCPVCAPAAAGQGRAAPQLVISAVSAGDAETVLGGVLQCSSCGHEFPIVDGIPVIVPDLRRLLMDRGVELLVRDDLDPAMESLLGDAIGPDSWFDARRQMESTYGWDAYADLDPDEAGTAEPGADRPAPGAARRCLAQLLALPAPADAPPARVLDLGCAAGRTSHDLAAAHPAALVLGLDVNLGLLRLAARALAGEVSYPRRRIGLAYDRRRFPASFAGSDRVDFWACDALALPFAPGVADLCAALNLLDCVPDPRRLLEGLAAVLRPGGRALLATPYDWSTRATPVESWLGGHSQRADHRGSGEAFLRALVDGVSPHAIPGLSLRAEQAAWPWHTRLHDRSAVHYLTHLVCLGRG